MICLKYRRLYSVHTNDIFTFKAFCGISEVRYCLYVYCRFLFPHSSYMLFYIKVFLLMSSSATLFICRREAYPQPIEPLVSHSYFLTRNQIDIHCEPYYCILLIFTITEASRFIVWYILSWFPVFNYAKKIKHTNYEKFVFVSSCQKLSKQITILQSYCKKGAIFMYHNVF